jgi:tetratricopeptide (TPR) repeat protein
MAHDPYAPCMCGSGKKFKWCCQPIHEQLAQVYQLQEEGQHEAALRLMDDVVGKNADNPEAWGRKAQLLFQSQKIEEAEQALEKAFALDPKYAFGYFLRAAFRLAEGEIAGGLMLLRKAAELYSPEANEILAQVYLEIFDAEMKLNHPVAAHAAAEIALRLNPTSEGLRNGIQQVFGPTSPSLPEAARKEYQFKPLPAGATADRKRAWDVALSGVSTGKLAGAAQAFKQLTDQDPQDAAAWYNLALSHAWLGQNPDALEALDAYVAREPDESAGAAAWTLGEVLRVGQGMEDQADHVEYSVTAALRDPQKLVGVLGELERERLLTGVQISQEEGVLTGILLEPAGPALTPELEAKQNATLGAYLVMMGNILRLWNTNKDALDRTFADLGKRAGDALAQAFPTRGPAKFHDILSASLVFPTRAASQEDAQERVREGIGKFFEEKWAHQPLKSLGGTPPIDAAGHATLRTKLRGVIDFLQQCAGIAHLPYDFDRLRHKLGLGGAPAAATTAAGGAGPDIGAMSAAELSALHPEALDYPQLEQAYHAALGLDARELAGQFATALVGHPPRAEKPDRYGVFNHLINQALARGDATAALDFVNAGERDDCEHNGGKRRNDYELRRGQVHAKLGEFDEAQNVFDRLIDRAPSELKYRATAAESMLSARQAPRARKYIDAGLAEARKQQNRDVEGHLMELQDAAKRQGG